MPPNDSFHYCDVNAVSKLPTLYMTFGEGNNTITHAYPPNNYIKTYANETYLAFRSGGDRFRPPGVNDSSSYWLFGD